MYIYIELCKCQKEGLSVIYGQHIFEGYKIWKVVLIHTTMKVGNIQTLEICSINGSGLYLSCVLDYF